MKHTPLWSSQHTIRFRFLSDTPVDIRQHPVPAGFQKLESGTSLLLTGQCELNSDDLDDLQQNEEAF